MYLSRILLLVPMILAAGREVQINNYVVKFMSDFPKTIESIEIIGNRSEQLNLFNMNIENFADNAFENITYIKFLNLSNNSLSVLRDTPFAILTNLEDLNLSHNNISEMKKPFANLSNLKLLNLSNTHIQELNASDFFGLTHSCVILVKGSNISSMSTEVFKNVTYHSYNFNEKNHSLEVSVPLKSRTKICIENTILISVEFYNKGENLTSSCSADRYYRDGFLHLNSLHIRGFQKGWYKLEDSSIHHIDLSSNNIARLTSAILNDLPESISSVDLAINRLERLRKGIIVNTYLRQISFQNNLIVEIKDDVFINTRLTTLTLSFNELKSTKFAATLPSTLTKIELEWNRIPEIFPDSFSNLNQLEVLQLDGNIIREIHRDSLRGLSNLKNLTLGTNRLKQIEAGSFKDLTDLEFLHLKHNFITVLESGVFDGLNNIKYISFDWNKMSHLTTDFLIGLPDSLEVLDLQHNTLENLKYGTFANSPKYELSLSHNNISNIEGGSFNLPDLKYLNLMYNSLSVIDIGTFQGLKNLQYLRLDMNNITKIDHGAFKHLRRLCILDISKNPIKKLEHGALHGLLRYKGCHVDLKDVPIEMIDGGVFADDGGLSVYPSFRSNY